MFRALALSLVFGICICACLAQKAMQDNPPITYSTPAVSVATAVDAIGRMAQKQLRVDDELAEQPIILSVHYARLSDVLDWIAAALHAKWTDQTGYKILRRTNYVSLSMQKSTQKTRAAAISRFLLNRQAQIAKEPLTLESAEQILEILYDPKVDHNSNTYREALRKSADERLINFTMQGVVPLEAVSSKYPHHTVFSNQPRAMQELLRFTNEQMDTLTADQNVWTSALAKFATSHPRFHIDASRRLPIPAKSRVLVKFSDVQNGLPTHVTVTIAGPGGHTRVRAETGITLVTTTSPPKIDWSTQHYSNPPVDSLDADFLNALQTPHSTVTAPLKDALVKPAKFDPLQFVASNVLQYVADHAQLNISACPPDSLLIDPQFQNLEHSDHIDSAKFLAVCQDTCNVDLTDNVMIISPKDPYVSEQELSPRQPMQEYVSLLAKKGYSMIDAEAKLAGANPLADFSLVRLYGSLLAPSATPFLDCSTATLAFYGSLSSPQRTTLTNGFPIKVSEMTDDQKELLAPILMDGKGRVVVIPPASDLMTDLVDPEITDVFNSPITPDEKVFAQRREETVVRVRGIDRFGRSMDEVYSLNEAKHQIALLAPWQSIEYATAKSNTIKMTFHMTRSLDYAEFMREYPSGFSAFGDIHALPADVRKALL